MPHDFTAFADALVRLDVGTRGYFLQEDLDWLGAGLAFEGQETGWLGWHGKVDENVKMEMISEDAPSLQPRWRLRKAALFRFQAPQRRHFLAPRHVQRVGCIGRLRVPGTDIVAADDIETRPADHVQQILARTQA